ncbi:MAG: aspartate aminotransferase family protein [Candidatus Desulfacyla sp.]
MPPKAVRAEGVWIYDEQGKKYLDASGGPICVNVGHGRAEVAEAIAKQAGELAYVHGPMFTSDPVEELARRLAMHAPEPIDRFYFCSSGCEAVETAVKLSHQIHVARGEPQRHRLIARWQSYHGATIGALSATGKPAMRNPFIPLLVPVVHIPPPYCLRCHFGLDYPSCGMRCAHALDEAIRLEGAHSVSAFIMEPIGGATIGALVPPPEYFTMVSEICRHHGVFLIFDEVMTGMGRTGKWFASEHFGVWPDLMVMGKGLNGGYAPLSAVGCRHEHLTALRNGPGNFVHGHTFSHHAVAAAAGLAVVNILEKEHLVEAAAKKGAHLEKLLMRLKSDPGVGDIRGIGMMWAVELVQDKSSLRPYPRKEKVTERLHEQLLEAGVITYTCTGFANGDGDALMLGPPFIISEEELGMAVDTIADKIREVLA